MAYPRKHLKDGEEVVLDLRPHWWFITPRMSVLLLALVIGIWAVASDTADPFLDILGGLLLIAALVWFGIRFAQWINTSFVVTTDRVIYRTGVLSKREVTIPLDRINTVIAEHALFERIIGAGDLEIESAGETPSHFTDIRRPATVQAEIYRQMEANENEKYDRIGAATQGGGGGGGAAPVSKADELAKLDELRQRGVLSEEEFAAQKAELLGGGDGGGEPAPPTGS